MTFTAACPDQASVGADDKDLRDRKPPSSLNPRHFLTLLRSQIALIRQIPLPEGLASEPCDLSAFGPGSAVTTRKVIPVSARSSVLVESCRNLVAALEAFVVKSGSASLLANAIFDFCHTVRMCRFSAPLLLQSFIDDETETGILLPFTNALKALTQNNESQVLACIDQLRKSNLFQGRASLSMSDITCSKIRRHLHSLQKLVAACKNPNNSGAIRSFIPVTSAIMLLLETTLQIMAWLHKFLFQSYVADEYEDILMSNICLLSGNVVSAAQDLLQTSAVEDSSLALSNFWISVKALIDIMVGEEQFGDEPLQGSHTGRQLLTHYMRKMQTARDKIREYLD